MTVNTSIATSNDMIHQKRKFVWPLAKSNGPTTEQLLSCRDNVSTEFSLDTNRAKATKDSHYSSSSRSSTAVDCDQVEDGDTQSCSSDDDSVYIDCSEVGGDESASELDTMLSKYLSFELQPKLAGDTTVLGLLYDDEQTQRRTVCFAENPITGEVVCTRYDNNYPLDPSEYVERWYNSADFQRFRHDNQKSVKVARRTPFLTDFTHIYESCATSSDKNPTLTRQRSVAVSESQYRGLESSLLFGTYFSERKAFIQQILKTQKQHGSLDRWTIDECAEALAVQARFLTKKSRRLALLLGSGDAMAAAALQTESDAPPLQTTAHASLVTSQAQPAPIQPQVPLLPKKVNDSLGSGMFEV